jgi:hypothetical protein
MSLAGSAEQTGAMGQGMKDMVALNPTLRSWDNKTLDHKWKLLARELSS